MGALSAIQNTYCRGSLEYCNYTCSYCPFSKKSAPADMDGDREVLHRFISRIGQWKYGALRTPIIPYGEAVIHRYYREGIIHLAAMPHIAGVSCQTNLSFSVSHFPDEIEEVRVDVTKIKFWGSYYPETAGVTDFTSKIEKLHAAGIEVCAEVVDDPSVKEQIRRLRLLLDPSIYLFVNAVQGPRKPLLEEDVRFFDEMDNLLNYDRRSAKACLSNCSRGRGSLFVDREGGMYTHPRSGVRTGSFCDDSTSLLQLSCLRKVCDCYIALSNLWDTPLRRMMREGALWRIPERKEAKAVFFDIDGTSTDVQGRVLGRIAPALKYIPGHLPLYLSTALPVAHAKGWLGDVFDLFSGGVFADGGFLCYEDTVERVSVEHPVALDFPGCRIVRYTWKGETLKYAVFASTVREATRSSAGLEEETYQLYQGGRLLAAMDSKTGKKNGLMTLCSRLGISLRGILVVGSMTYDWPMMSVVGYFYAVMDAEGESKKLSGYILNPDSIPVFFDI